MKDGWFVISLVRGEDEKAEIALRRLGIELHKPTLTTKVKHRRYKVMVARTVPMFPGYLFIRHVRSWGDVLRVDGVAGVLQGAKGDNSFQPVTVPGHVVSELSSVTRPVDLVSLFQVGEMVRLTAGPLIGYTGEVIGHEGPERIRVSLAKSSVVVPQRMAQAA